MIIGGKPGRIIPLGGDMPSSMAPEPDRMPPPRRPETKGLLPLLIVLPLFAQVFHYMIDVGPIYYLSKAWPVLTLPLAIYGIFALKSRFAFPYLAALIYVMGVTPVLSMLWLGNSMLDALANSVKVWPLAYYFSLLALLVYLQPTPETIIKAVLRLGVGTMLVMWMLWLVVPDNAYSGDPAKSRLFLYEYERGNRVFFPMTFALLAMFYAARRMMDRPRFWQFAIIFAGIATQIHIFKLRMVLASSVIVLIGIAGLLLPRLWRSIAVALGGLAGVAGLWVLLSHLDKFLQALGFSLLIRENSLSLLQNYLAQQPLRWIFGAGAASRVGRVNMADIIGRKDFFLADLGWPGIVFEFGVLGALTLIALYFVVLRWSWRQVPAVDPAHRAMITALTAYIVYLVAQSMVYSVVYTPGELTTMTSLLLYMVTVTRPDSVPPKPSRRLM